MSKPKRPAPAECFPPGEFILDEIEARGWTEEDLAYRMGASTEDEFAQNLLTLHLIIEFPEYKGRATRMGDGVAEQLGKAFGTSAELWANLETSWIEYVNNRN